MKYIVGLGNPGTEYENTRHNVGWLLLDEYVADSGMSAPVSSAKFSGRVSEGVVDGEEVIVLYPDTFMNNSGAAVKKLVPKAESEQLVVVYDDVDLPIGELKVSFGKGDGGHNGIKSIVKELGTKDFARIRIGIAPKSFWTGKPRRPAAGAAMTRHVLGRFSKTEEKQLQDVFKKAIEAITIIHKEGVAAAMNRCN